MWSCGVVSQPHRHVGQLSGVADKNTSDSLTMICCTAPGNVYPRALPNETTL